MAASLEIAEIAEVFLDRRREVVALERGSATVDAIRVQSRFERVQPRLDIVRNGIVGR